MKPKHIGLTLGILLLAAAWYYFTSGQKQITAHMKTKVNRELISLQNEGFSIHKRKTGEKHEHFSLSFDKPKKIARFLSRQGLQLNTNDAELLRGLQVGVDVHYLADAYSALSLDLYPVTLPHALAHTSHSTSEQKALDQVQKMLEKKTFLMHLAINKLGTGFKGYMKDIHEVLHGEQDVNLSITGLTFFGNIKDDSFRSITQALNNFSMQVPHELNLSFKNLNSKYVITGDTAYDYKTNYTIENIQLYARSQFDVEASDITAESDSHGKSGLLSGSTLSTIKSVKLAIQNQSYMFQDLNFSIKTKNLDVKALARLQEANTHNEQEMNALLQQLLSKGVQVEIPSLSIDTITDANGHKIDGFKLNAKADINKSLNLASLRYDPLAALTAANANVHLELSPALYSLIAEQPRAIMLMMLFPPKDMNGSKVYDLKLKDGKPAVNGLLLF